MSTTMWVHSESLAPTSRIIFDPQTEATAFFHHNLGLLSSTTQNNDLATEFAGLKTPIVLKSLFEQTARHGMWLDPDMVRQETFIDIPHLSTDPTDPVRAAAYREAMFTAVTDQVSRREIFFPFRMNSFNITGHNKG
jgi:hypothetical protein